MAVHRHTLHLLLLLLLGGIVVLFIRRPWRRDFKLKLDNAKVYSTPPRVRVELYMEGLCPFSKKFFIKQLLPTWLQLKHILDVEVFPYGNVKEVPFVSGNEGNIFECLRGPDECQANVMLGCAQKYSFIVDDFIHFTFCMLKAESPLKAGYKCARKMGIPLTQFDSCSSGGAEGQALLHGAGTATARQFPPPIGYLPRVVVNGVEMVPSENFKEHVCDAYIGRPRPQACEKK